MKPHSKFFNLVFERLPISTIDKMDYLKRKDEEN